jgi:hypothetical protein
MITDAPAELARSEIARQNSSPRSPTEIYPEPGQADAHFIQVVPASSMI